MSKKREWGATGDLGTITSPVDAREEFDGLYPVVCQWMDCKGDVEARVRLGSAADDIWYLCGRCASLPEFACPPKDRDWLGERINA